LNLIVVFLFVAHTTCATAASPNPFFPRSICSSKGGLFAPNHELIDYVSDAETTYVDVREDHETMRPPFLYRPFIKISVKTFGDSTAIRSNVELMKLGRHKPVIVFSGLFGVRAQRAKAEMEKVGFTKVLNGGSINDVIDAVHFQETKERKRNHWQRLMDVFQAIGSSVLYQQPWTD